MSFKTCVSIKSVFRRDQFSPPPPLLPPNIPEYPHITSLCSEVLSNPKVKIRIEHHIYLYFLYNLFLTTYKHIRNVQHIKQY